MAAWDRVPDHIRRSLKDRYPTLELRWNHRKECFELIEHAHRGAVGEERVLWDYSNYDGTAQPVVWDWLYRHICLSDTRKFPMMDRLQEMRAEKAMEERRKMDVARRRIGDMVTDDYHYFADIPTFFMGPSMQEARAKFRPSQERAIKAGSQ
jgi:hypothetical protein